MKQPDTAALRERLANYTPEEELKQDMQELDGLLQELGCQIIEFRKLLKEVNALKEELHGIHGSLKHTVQWERAASRLWKRPWRVPTTLWTASATPLLRQNGTLSYVQKMKRMIFGT